MEREILRIVWKRFSRGGWLEGGICCRERFGMTHGGMYNGIGIGCCKVGVGEWNAGGGIFRIWYMVFAFFFLWCYVFICFMNIVNSSFFFTSLKRSLLTKNKCHLLMAPVKKLLPPQHLSCPFRTSYTLLRPLQRLSIVSFLFDKAKGASLHIIKPRLVVVGLSSNYALIIPLKFYYEWFCWTYTFHPETRGHFSNSQTTIPNLVFLVALTSNCACFFYPFSFDGHLS